MGGVDSNKLTTVQVRLLSEGLFPRVNYLYRLKTRMEKTGFVPGDPLDLPVCRAHEGIHRLWVEVHYLSCESGVGRAGSE